MQFQDNHYSKKLKFAIVISRFNNFITKQLLEGAFDCFIRNNIQKDDIDIIWVPGAFEIPLIAKKCVQKNKYNAVIALGCIIRGDTSHYEHVCTAVTSGVTSINVNYDVPVIFGILTTDTLEQAIDRAGGKSGNKGHDAALSAIEMANIMIQL